MYKSLFLRRLMQVFRDLKQLPQFANSVITIGMFDGVHSGHRDIIQKLIELAKETASETTIITFHPHPRHIIAPGQPVFYLTTLDEKLNILQSLNISNVIVVPFSREFSEMDAMDYAENFLIKNFNPKCIVFGYDHKFGKNREGDIHLLKSIAEKYHIRVEEIPAHIIDSLTVSSSKIRNFLLEGNISEANNLLGYAYPVSGIVVKGDQLGRTLGYPTANIHVEDEHKLIPGDGVYVVDVKLKHVNNHYYGLLNIGTRPTFNKTEKRIEVFIFDFDQTIYGEEITVKFLKFLRKDKKFNSADELVSAMDLDKANGLEFINSVL